MSAVTNVWRQLVQRRLWPVAILLVAALAAVPLALAQDPESPPPAAPLPVGDSDEAALASAPIVTPVSAADQAGRRKVLGKEKNPFGLPPQAGTGSAAAADKAAKTTTTTTSVSKSSDTSSPGTGSGGSVAPSAPSGTPAAPTAPAAPTTPAEPRKTYDRYDLTIRFGDSSGAMQRMTLKRLQPLPDASAPTLIYLGVTRDGKSAVFLVEKDVEAVGDGSCRPAPDACETVRLKAGETEFLDVVDEAGNVTAQYQLDLVKIHKGTTGSASKASASSKAGRALLADRGPAPYRFDAGSGTLERRPGVVGDVARSIASIG